MVKISGRIIELRKERNITQKQLAEAVNVGQSTVSGWENGLFEPTASVIRDLCSFFEVSADYLLDIEQ